MHHEHHCCSLNLGLQSEAVPACRTSHATYTMFSSLGWTAKVHFMLALIKYVSQTGTIQPVYKSFSGQCVVHSIIRQSAACRIQRRAALVMWPSCYRWELFCNTGRDPAVRMLHLCVENSLPERQTFEMAAAQLITAQAGANHTVLCIGCMSIAARSVFASRKNMNGHRLWPDSTSDCLNLDLWT